MTSVLLPLDVIRNIVEYSSDIDVRRSFGVYGKLDYKPYELLLKGFIRFEREHGSTGQEDITRYSLYNIIDTPARQRAGIMDDSIQVVVFRLPESGHLLYEIDMYKLKPRTYLAENRRKESECPMPLGPLRNEYYWEATLYNYSRVSYHYSRR